MFEKGTTWSPARRNAAIDAVGVAAACTTEDAAAGAAGVAGGGAVAGSGGAGAGAGAGAVGAACRRASTTLSTSSRVMRPPTPVPATSEALIALSDRSLRTTGESTNASALPSLPGGGVETSDTDATSAGGAGGGAGAGAGEAGGGAGATGAGAGAAGAGAGAAGASGSAAGGAAPAVAASPITARRTPTSTVSPSGTRISVRTPAAGDGTSESTLSVETSNRGSSRATVSPMAFIHRVTVPSVTVSPNCGIVTSANVQSPSGQRHHRLAE